MVMASSLKPPPVVERPLDPSIARRSLAIIAGAEASEMSDEEARDGVDFLRLVGFPLDELPDDGDPHKAIGFFRSLGLTADFAGMDFEPPKPGGAVSRGEGNAAVLGAVTPMDSANAHAGDGDDDDDTSALAFLKGAK